MKALISMQDAAAMQRVRAHLYQELKNLKARNRKRSFKTDALMRYWTDQVVPYQDAMGHLAPPEGIRVIVREDLRCPVKDIGSKATFDHLPAGIYRIQYVTTHEETLLIGGIRLELARQSAIDIANMDDTFVLTCGWNQQLLDWNGVSFMDV
ncbi:hypothetical protein GF380_06575 [Candidatus Uhrbacteria bacterium]|nr:hypothetical protein [Candidatus Uhrbacteria bacterium]MBD3284599.1 hypothetical protein [Candidatus Uhrbacteria bacterium]